MLQRLFDNPPLLFQWMPSTKHNPSPPDAYALSGATLLISRSETLSPTFASAENAKGHKLDLG